MVIDHSVPVRVHLIPNSTKHNEDGDRFMMPRHLLPRIGNLPQGLRNSITDVAGVTVGHCTLDANEVQTGVTVVVPHSGDLFRDRVPAGAVVLNGFGKSVGLVQVDELGLLETPIALTNTFSVPTVAAAQIRQCIAANPETGRLLPTVNPLVFECNDGFLNDIQRMVITEDHYQHACAHAGPNVAEGSVGAGRGMSCFELKGGVGTASRCVPAAVGDGYILGALVLANYGRLPQLVMGGRPLGSLLSKTQTNPLQTKDVESEKGSIILLIATDAPLDARQLRRLALRAGAGLARTGSVFGHGSGDIALAFSTAYTIPQLAAEPMPTLAMLHDGLIDPLFQAVADSTEQAIMHAILGASSVTGRNGHQRKALTDMMPNWADFFRQ